MPCPEKTMPLYFWFSNTNIAACTTIRAIRTSSNHTLVGELVVLELLGLQRMHLVVYGRQMPGSRCDRSTRRAESAPAGQFPPRWAASRPEQPPWRRPGRSKAISSRCSHDLSGLGCRCPTQSRMNEKNTNSALPALYCNVSTKNVRLQYSHPSCCMPLSHTCMHMLI